MLKKKPKQLELAAHSETISIEREDFLKYNKAIKRSRLEEFVRFNLNFQIVTVLSWFNFVFLAPLALFTWLMNLFGFFDLAILNYLPWWLFILVWMIPYLTWCYSTITIPKKKGKVILKDWSKTKEGRWKSAVFNLVPLHLLSWCAAAKYTKEYFFDYLISVRLHEPYQKILLTDDLDSLLLILFVAPVIFSGIAIFIQIRDYMINKDLLKETFKEWEAPFIRKYAHEYQLASADIIVGYELETKKPIVIKESERFLHEAIFGPTGSGKTSTTLLLRIASDIVKMVTGERKMGLIFLEPKGDGVDDVLTICDKLGYPREKIKVIDPLKSWSVKYNPFMGNRDSAAASFQGTLNALTVDQDDFFRGQQNEAASFYTLLAKIRFGPATNITHIQRMFTDPRYLADVVESVRKTINSRKNDETLSVEWKQELDAFEQIVSYFENEVLEYQWVRTKDGTVPMTYPPGHKYEGRQRVDSKKDKFVTGAKKYLNEIANNTLLRILFVNAEDEEVFDADQFLKEGGIVLVNTALGELDELSLLFGQFFIRQFQAAVFRRAKEMKEKGVERIPIFFYIDEFPLYANEAFERFLTLARSYKVGAIIAMQSIGQLESVGDAYKKAVLGNASHKTVFGRLPVEDNEYFSKEFGEHIIVEESMNESGTPMTSEKQIWSYRLNTQKKRAPRFSATEIHELPFKQMIVQIVDESNSITKPKHAIGSFVHEDKFLKRFLELHESEIKSTEEKPFDYSNYVNSKTLSGLTTNINTAYKQVPSASNPDEILDISEAHSLMPRDVEKQLYALSNSIKSAYEEQQEQLQQPGNNLHHAEMNENDLEEMHTSNTVEMDELNSDASEQFATAMVNEEIHESAENEVEGEISIPIFEPSQESDSELPLFDNDVEHHSFSLSEHVENTETEITMNNDDSDDDNDVNLYELWKQSESEDNELVIVEQEHVTFEKLPDTFLPFADGGGSSIDESMPESNIELIQDETLPIEQNASAESLLSTSNMTNSLFDETIAPQAIVIEKTKKMEQISLNFDDEHGSEGNPLKQQVEKIVVKQVESINKEVSPSQNVNTEKNKDIWQQRIPGNHTPDTNEVYEEDI